MKQCCSLLALSLGLLAAIPAVAAPADLLAGSSWSLLTPKGAAELKTPTAAGVKILHVTVSKPSKTYYEIQLTHDIAPSLPAKASLRYEFWARSKTKNPIHAVVEKRTTPYTHLLDKPITLTPDWKKYTVEGSTPEAYGKNGLAGRLQVGEKAGEIEFKGITLVTAPAGGKAAAAK